MMQSPSRSLRQQLVQLARLSNKLNIAATEQDVLETAAAFIPTLIASDRASVAFVIDDHFEVLAFQGSNVIPLGAKIPLVNTCVEHCTRTHKLVSMPDLTRSSWNDHQQLVSGGIHSALVAPLICMGKAIGTLNVGHTRCNAFSESDEALFEQLAAMLSSSLDNRRLFDQTQSALRDSQEYSDKLAVLSELGKRLNKATSEAEVFRIVGEFVARLLHPERASATLLDESGTMLQPFLLVGAPPLAGDPVTMRMPMDHTLPGRACRTGEAIYVPDTTKNDAPGTRYIRSLGLRSVAIAPFQSAGRTAGTLNMAVKARDGFDERSRDLLQHIASLLGAALENTRLYAEAEHARRVAEQASEAKTQFLACMSHEIRTPLNAVIGMTELLLDSPLSDEQWDYVDTVRTSGAALLRIISDILDFSRIEAQRVALETAAFDLHQVIEESLDMVAMEATAKGLSLLYSAESNVPEWIVGDAVRLRQVLMNLLSNAVKFTDTGEVTVAVSATERPTGKFEITLAVRDTGMGIGPDQLGRLFQDFEPLDASITRRHGGAGLGLVISRRLVELMGGRIWVDSQAGVGSTFVASIPARGVDTHHAQHATPPTDSLSGLSALVVDPNASYRDLLTGLMTSWDMTVQAIAHTRDAIQDTAQGGAPTVAWVSAPDVIIIDNACMDQLDAMLQAAAQVGRFPAVIQLVPLGLTSSARPSKTRALRRLHKPLKPRRLARVLANIATDRASLTQPEAARARARASLALAPNDEIRILVAEDNLVNQKVVLRILARLGYHAEIVANGMEVLAAFDRQHYHVVLMDVHMPKMSGLEATMALRARLEQERQPYIIAITADALSGSRDRFLSAGMDAYLSKPIHMAELARSLERVLEQDN